MYSDWSSHVLSSNGWLQQSESVLKGLQLSPDSAHQIVALVVQPLASNLSAAPSLSSKQMDDHHIIWCMEVIGYGLGLPLSEHETIRDCVHIYCEWLSVLLPQPKTTVPLPLLKIPNHYSRKIIGQLYHLFIPRAADDGSDLINRQAVLCHRVLRTIQLIATHSVIIDCDTWESLLILLLAINDALLPTSLSASSDVGDHLCDRVLSALFDVWLHACAKSFPSPRLWKSLTRLAKEWCQKPTLITHWNKINNNLTSRLLSELCGPSRAGLTSFCDHDDKDIPSRLTGELLAQTWFRFLHCIGNPVQLTSQSSSSNKILRNGVLDSTHSVWPSVSANVMMEFMRGISCLADIILGKLSLPFASINKPAEKNDSSASLSRDQILYRARCNSLLHLFGSWLFQAALLESDYSNAIRGASPFTTDRSRASSVSISSEPSLVLARPRSATAVDAFETPISSASSTIGYDNGRAQAIGTLCRIVCSKKSDEEILPLYLARFFVALHCCLKLREEKCVSDVMASVFLNSPPLFRINLDGVFSILPAVVDALECVLLPKDLKIKSNANRTEIRRAAIYQLISTACVPQHYWQLSLRDFVGFNTDGMHLYFIHLRPRLLALTFSALQTETDPLNLHLLLGCLGCVIKDISAFEAFDPVPNSYSHAALSHSVSLADGSSNVFSSVSDAHSWHSSASVSYPSLSENIPGSPNDGDPLLSGYLSSVANAAVHLLAQKLLTLWKSDVNVSIAALEVLACMSKISSISANESHRVVYLLCEYIMVQCSRPPPAHSKDLHSTIVAAFGCCGSWLSSHPYLATDTECLLACLQVIELGISGMISQPGKTGEIRKKKHEKELKPVSLRVRDAAESLLTNLLEILGNSSQHVKSEKYSKHRRETRESLGSSEVYDTNDSSRFLYFASTDGTMLLGVKNEVIKRDSSAEPVVTLGLRNPFGHQSWVSQMRHLPRHKSGMQTQMSNPGHPLAMNDLHRDHSLIFECFPESVERARACLADKSLPSLDSTSPSYEEGGSELELIASLINMPNESIFMENDVRNDKCDWRAPSESDSSRSARLFLSHLGLLRLGIQENDFADTMFVGLDSSVNYFSRELDDLDLAGPRSHDTVSVFYVKSGQKLLSEILSNTFLSIKDSRFSEFIRALGWPVDPSTSCAGDCNSRLPDGTRNQPKLISQSFFWSDGLNDISFIFRHIDSLTSDSLNDSVPRRSQDYVPLDSATSTRRSKLANQLPNPEMKVIIVWLECYEDLNSFPTEELLDSHLLSDPEQTKKEEFTKEHYFIFIHPLISGLFRIHLQHSSTSKIQFATPLVDGAVVSQRTLGSLIRQTCINLGKRRRLDYESYQLPHIRRKVRIADIVSKYRTNLQPSSFITHMFSQL